MRITIDVDWSDGVGIQAPEVAENIVTTLLEDYEAGDNGEPRMDGYDGPFISFVRIIEATN